MMLIEYVAQRPAYTMPSRMDEKGKAWKPQDGSPHMRRVTKMAEAQGRYLGPKDWTPKERVELIKFRRGY
jgi:hypothetical protein